CGLPYSSFNNVIEPFWDDLRTDQFYPGTCNGYGGVGCGIFTSTTGIAGSRTFIVEWRAADFSGGVAVNFELIMHENSPNFEYMYANVRSAPDASSGSGATIAVQRGTGSQLTQYSCNQARLP